MYFIDYIRMSLKFKDEQKDRHDSAGLVWKSKCICCNRTSWGAAGGVITD